MSPLSHFRSSFCIASLALALVPPTNAGAADKRPAGPAPISLEQAYDRALSTDQSIRIAYWEIRKANLLPWSALTRLGPNLTAGGSYVKNSSSTRSTVVQNQTVNVDGVPTTVSRFVDFTNTNRTGNAQASVSFVQPLIDLTVFPAYKLGNISKVVARLEHQYTVRGTLFGVAQAYYEVLKQQRLVDVDREALRLAGEQLDIAQKRADVGEVTRSDVLRAQVAVETARRILVEDENGLELDRNTLRNTLNLNPGDPIAVIEPPDYPTTLPAFQELLGKAYQHREDLRVKELAIDQDIQRRNEVIGEYGPKVVAQFDGSRGHVSGDNSSSNYDWQASVSIQLPILTGGQREIDLLTANRQIEQTKLDRERTAKTVEADVKSGWLSVRTLEQTLKALHAQVVAAEQGYHDLENQYRAGTATSVDVLSALNDLNNARKDLAVQTYDYQVALRNLEQITGVFQQTRVEHVKVR